MLRVVLARVVASVDLWHNLGHLSLFEIVHALSFLILHHRLIRHLRVCFEDHHLGVVTFN